MQGNPASTCSHFDCFKYSYNTKKSSIYGIGHQNLPNAGDGCAPFLSVTHDTSHQRSLMPEHQGRTHLPFQLGNQPLVAYSGAM